MRRLVLACMILAGVTLHGMSVCQRAALVNCEYNLVDVEPNFELTKVVLDAYAQIENVNEMDVIIDRIDMDFLTR